MCVTSRVCRLSRHARSEKRRAWTPQRAQRVPGRPARQKKPRENRIFMSEREAHTHIRDAREYAPSARSTARPRRRGGERGSDRYIVSWGLPRLTLPRTHARRGVTRRYSRRRCRRPAAAGGATRPRRRRWRPRPPRATPRWAPAGRVVDESRNGRDWGGRASRPGGGGGGGGARLDAGEAAEQLESDEGEHECDAVHQVLEGVDSLVHRRGGVKRRRPPSSGLDRRPPPRR